VTNKPDQRPVFTREMLITYLRKIGCVAIGFGEATRYNPPWEAFTIALATREGFDVSQILGRISRDQFVLRPSIDGATILSDSELAVLVETDLECESFQEDIDLFRQMFVNLGEPAGSVQTLIDRDK
jgi:hypothetical protein